MDKEREIKSDKVIEELKESCKRHGVEGYLFTTMDEKNNEAAWYFSFPKNIPEEDVFKLLYMITGRIVTELLLFVNPEQRRETGLEILDASLGFATHIEEKESEEKNDSH